MGKSRLTAKAIESFAAPDKRKDIYDGEVPVLVLRLLPSGTKSWSFTYRIRGRAKRLSLGVYPGVTLKLARERARDARAEIQRGNDPVEDKKQSERERELYNFEVCATDFVAKYCRPNLRSWKNIESVLERFAIKERGHLPANEIRRRDVVELLDKVAINTPGQSNHLRAYLSRLFKWLIEREVVSAKPVIGVTRRHKTIPRNRILSDDEIVALWKVTEDLGGTFGSCIRLLLTTGVRLKEASKLTWAELDGDFALLEASRMKGGRDFKVPLSFLAKDVIRSTPKLGEFVFTTNGRSPISGWSKTKVKIDAMLEAELEEPVADWRIHDLRRTVVSGMAMLGVRSEVIKHVLGHAANANDVTAVHYLWHNYDKEALEAAEKWAKHIESLVPAKTAKLALVS